MVDLQRYELNSAGRDWVSDNLSFGEPLGDAVLGAIDLDRGQVYTLLEAGLSLEGVRELQWSRLTASTCPLTSTADLDDALVELVLESLRRYAPAICVFEDLVASESDSVIARDPAGLHFCEGSVYVILRSDAVHDDVRRALSLVRPAFPPLRGIVATVSSDAAISVHVDSAQVRMWAAGTRRIVVGAYDGEGFVVWERADGRDE